MLNRLLLRLSSDFNRWLRAWRYATDTMTKADAQWLSYHADNVAGCWPLECIGVDGLLEYVREIWPQLQEHRILVAVRLTPCARPILAYIRTMTTRTQIAWAAGLFEGEGCFTIHANKKTGRNYPRASLASSDRDIVLRFAKIIGGGIIDRQAPTGYGIKHLWRWTICGYAKVKHVGDLFAEWLGERRRTQLSKVLASYIDPGPNDRYANRYEETKSYKLFGKRLRDLNSEEHRLYKLASRNGWTIRTEVA